MCRAAANGRLAESTQRRGGVGAPLRPEPRGGASARLGRGGGCDPIIKEQGSGGGRVKTMTPTVQGAYGRPPLIFPRRGAAAAANSWEGFRANPDGPPPERFFLTIKILFFNTD